MTKRHSVDKYFLRVDYMLGMGLMPGKQIKKKYTPSLLSWSRLAFRMMT